LDCFSDPDRRRRGDEKTENRKEENFQQRKGDGVSVAESTNRGMSMFQKCKLCIPDCGQMLRFLITISVGMLVIKINAFWRVLLRNDPNPLVARCKTRNWIKEKSRL
jgi:hypothetical protein